MIKKITILLFLLMGLLMPLKAQYNPYLDKKRKNKPSAVMAKKDKKNLKQQKKQARKQLRRSRRKVKGNKR